MLPNHLPARAGKPRRSAILSGGRTHPAGLRFPLADKDTAMHSGVITRTIVLDRMTKKWLARTQRGGGPTSYGLDTRIAIGWQVMRIGITWIARRPWPMREAAAGKRRDFLNRMSAMDDWAANQQAEIRRC